jgi:hypothetical protein
MIFKQLLFRSLFTLLATNFLLLGCTNSLLQTTTSVLTTGIIGVTGTTGTTSLDNLIISSISILSPAGANAGTPPTTTISFDTSKSSTSIITHCNAAATASQVSKPCVCQFNWKQVDPTGASTTSVSRSVQSPLVTVQTNQVTCLAPSAYSTEISTGTPILIKVLGTANNGDAGLFTVPQYSYTVGSTTATGDFSDSQGHLFDNVIHYACYEKYTRSLKIYNKIATINSPDATYTGLPKMAPIATQFCIGVTTPTPDCPNVVPNDYSAQAYYYNFFIRSSESGGINNFNDNYICPTVTEALNSTGSVGTKNQFWPLDQSFAVSLSSTTNFNVGILSRSKLANGADPTTADSTCTAPAAGAAAPVAGGDTGGFITSCLGFAARINTDGTCPYFKDSAGLTRATYRLRRYVALYPRVFDTNGKVLAKRAQGADYIYVLDRPVQGPSTSNPLKPYTMAGPKPCPFAYFDRTGAVQGNSTKQGYYASSNVGWAGKNVDGIEFPNADSNGVNAVTNITSAPSCAAAIPILSADGSTWGITTLNATSSAALTSVYQHMYIRPGQPLTPHYEEDTDFQACAPQASPLQDPPLHFSRDPVKGNVSWCAESYPTQNTNITSLDPPQNATTFTTNGTIAPFTSHVVKNSASASCNFTHITIPSTNYNYPGTAARHGQASWDISVLPAIGASQTCDRTVSSSGPPYQFPLLSPSADMETAIAADSSYGCLMTYDNGGSKTITTTRSSPADGCCNVNSVGVRTGLTTGTPANAHLEPDVPCRTPKY